MTKRQQVRALKLAVSLTAVFLLVRQVNGPGLVAALESADWMLTGVAALGYLVGQALSSCRWLVVARSVGFRCTLGQMVRYYFVGMFFNIFGPATVGGDLVRGFYLAGGPERRAAALNTVFFDRLVGLVMLVVVLTAAVGSFGTFGLPPSIAWLAAAAGMVLVAGWWTLPTLARRVLGPDNRWRRLIEVDLAPLWRDRRMLFVTAALSIFFHVCQIGAVILVGEAVGLGVEWTYYFVFHPLVSIFSALPISVAGFGLREVGYVYLLSDVGGVNVDRAAAFSILWFGVLLFSALAGGAVYLFSGEAIPGRETAPR